MIEARQEETGRDLHRLTREATILRAAARRLRAGAAPEVVTAELRADGIEPDWELSGRAPQT